MTKRWGDTALGLLLSAGIHLVLLLGTALLFIEQLIAFDVDVTIACGFPESKPRIDPEPPRDIIERKGIPSDDGHLFDLGDESLFEHELVPPDAWFLESGNSPRGDVQTPGLIGAPLLPTAARRPFQDSENHRVFPNAHGVGCPKSKVYM